MRKFHGDCDCRIIPAHAGSTLDGGDAEHARTDHPRSRGEHNWKRFLATLGAGSSPLTRGAPGVVTRRPAPGRIIPAHAGSTVLVHLIRQLGRDHPRSRGEHSIDTADARAHAGSSPLTRGAPSSFTSSDNSAGIIPAHAGSTASTPPTLAPTPDHPRSRGEHIVVEGHASVPPGSSPLTRGAPGPERHRVGSVGIIPAHAGSTCAPRPTSRRSQDHPRSRGEHQLRSQPMVRTRGSSPLTRGALPRPHPRGGPTQDHPRSRGEHHPGVRYRPEVEGSSPLTRGAPSRRDRPAGDPRIIPAHAGSTSRCWTSADRGGDHPRSRGEHHSPATSSAYSRGSSPLTRGAPTGSHGYRPRHRDHPRSRGEHVTRWASGWRVCGSSPLTRGALPITP